MLPLELKNLIHVEQQRQNYEFILGVSANDYIVKIENQAEILIHHSAGKYNGFLAFYCNNFASKIAYIALILIAEPGRGKGIGSELLCNALMTMKKRGFRVCNLEVRSKNSSAINLYTRYGFQITESSSANVKMQLELQYFSGRN